MTKKLTPLLLLLVGFFAEASPEANLGEGFATVYFEITVSSNGRAEKIEILKIIDGGDGSTISDLNIPEKQIKRIKRNINKSKYEQTSSEENKRVKYWIYDLATKKFLKRKYANQAFQATETQCPLLDYPRLEMNPTLLRTTNPISVA